MLRTSPQRSCHFKKRRALATVFFFLWVKLAVAVPFDSHIHSRSELEFGVVLFDYFQQDYFSALIEFEYNDELGNPLAKEGKGHMLQGGMMVSYGMPDEAEIRLHRILDSVNGDNVRNRIWYFLARLYYNKSEQQKAYDALDKISGNVDKELHFDYHYLATLIRNDGSHLAEEKKAIEALSKDNPAYPYLLFNFAISHLVAGDLTGAVANLEKVAAYTGQNEEMSVLADRATHGLAQLALQAGHVGQAWYYLRNIRTSGLYSNRALLSYAWAAIKLKQYNDAIPALEILNSRSIAIPEVQEAKVLLAHLYEQQGAPRQALKSNLLAEKQFRSGLNLVGDARKAIDLLDVPREFIANLEAIKDEEDWYGTRPSVDYMKLTPFLIDLMASNEFNETLRELADLYAIEDNLMYWKDQAEQHLLILEAASKRDISQQLRDTLARKKELTDKFIGDSADLKLYTLTLNEAEQVRMDALLESTETELALLEEKALLLSNVEAAYKHPASYKKEVETRHKQVEEQLKRTGVYIRKLEPVMRRIVNAELDKHEDRMGYYLAQSRLAKARLYDTTLLSLERAGEQDL